MIYLKTVTTLGLMLGFLYVIFALFFALMTSARADVNSNITDKTPCSVVVLAYSAPDQVVLSDQVDQYIHASLHRLEESANAASKPGQPKMDAWRVIDIGAQTIRVIDYCRNNPATPIFFASAVIYRAMLHGEW